MVMFLPLPLGLNLLVIAHILSGAVGMFLLLRALGADTLQALLGAIIFEAYPKIFAHLANGHVTMVMAVSWMPWLFLVEVKKRNEFLHPKSLLLSSFVFSLVLTADIRWAFYTGVIWGLSIFGFRLFKLIADWKKFFLSAGIKVILGCLLSSSLLFPFSQFFYFSSRILLEQSDVMIYSLPFLRFINLIYPDIGGFGEWQIYPGVVPVFLFVLCLINPQTRIQSLGIALLIFGFAISATGEYSGLGQIIGSLPFIGMLRVPPRILNSWGFLLGLIPILITDKRFSPISLQKNARYFNLAVSFLSLTGISIGIYIITLTHNYLNGFLWGGAILGLIFISFNVFLKNFLTREVWLVTLIGLAIVDSGFINLNSIQFVSIEDKFRQDAKIFELLKTSESNDLFRVYSPSYSLGQETSILANLYRIDGVNPMLLLKYVKFFEIASGIPIRSYTVTLPPYQSGNPRIDNHLYLPSADAIGLLNGKYIVSEFPIGAEGFDLIMRIENTWIYKNLRSLPRAWLEMKTGLQKQVVIQHYSPNKIIFSTEDEGMLVLSEINYPGWRVWIDGVEHPVQEINGLLRSTIVPPGNHVVEFVYIPSLFYIGMGVSIVTLVSLIFLYFWKWRTT
jgi:hypothetical protein